LQRGGGQKGSLFGSREQRVQKRPTKKKTSSTCRSRFISALEVDEPTVSRGKNRGKRTKTQEASISFLVASETFSTGKCGRGAFQEMGGNGRMKKHESGKARCDSKAKKAMDPWKFLGGGDLLREIFSPRKGRTTGGGNR